MVSDRGDHVYLQFEHAVFEKNLLFPFPLVAAKWIGDNFINKRYAQNFGASIYSRVINIKTCLLRKWRCGSNSPRKLCTKFDIADFFLFRAASLFTLRTFGAQINWRVISGKILFDPHRFLSNKSPIHFAGESGNTFLNGKRHVQNENGHRSPRSQTYAQQL